MPRPLEREKPLRRVNVLLDDDAIDAARKKAISEDIRNIAIAGNTSKLLRWVVDRYVEDGF